MGKLSKEQLAQTIILTTEARASYVHVFSPSEVKDKKGKATGKKQYSIELLFPKKTTKLSEILKPLKAAATFEFGEDMDWDSLKKPISDGDKAPKKGKEARPETAGCWIVRASSSAEFAAPHVVDLDPEVKLENDTQFYSGAYCRAQLKAFAYDFGEGSAGVKFILDGVQKTKDGDRLGGRKAASEMFGIIEGDAGDEDLGEEAEESFM